MSRSSSSTDVDDDEDFFDRPMNSKQGAAKTAAADERSSPPPAAGGAGCASTSGYQQQRRSLRHSSSDDSRSDHSSEGKRASPNEHDRRKGAPSTKSAVVIQLPSESQKVGDDSKTSEGGSAEREDSFRKQPPLHKKNKKVVGEHKERAADIEHENRGKKSSLSSHSRSDYSSDEEKRQSESRPSRRSASSTSTSYSGQRLGTCKKLRSTSAPSRRLQQLRPVVRGNQSRMDVRALLESLLEVENARPRRKCAAKPVEFRQRLNYTFSDQRLEMIERENKRLLENLVKIHYAEPTYDWKPATPSVKPATFPDAARIKQLEKIQKENLELLQRLKSTEPSRDICRSALLADYNRNRAYLGHSQYCPAPQRNKSRRRRRLI